MDLNDKILWDISKRLGPEWKELAVYLNFSGAEIFAFQCDNPNHDLNDQIYRMLITWRQLAQSLSSKQQTTVLCRALTNIGRSDIKAMLRDETDVEMPVSPPPASNDAFDFDNVYQMKSKPRGIAVIINNKKFRTMNTRTGTDIDSKNLKYVFEKKLGFKTYVKEDQTGKQMKQILRDLSTLNHDSFDCFILAILSHGKEDAIYGVDECTVTFKDVLESFEDGKCPSLVGKPKLFFLQASRGERMDNGFEATDSKGVQPSGANSEFQDEIDGSNVVRLALTLPIQSDMLLAYSTVQGFVSWRNLEHGSWFVQALSEVLLKHSDTEDLLSMMTMVNNKVARAFESSSGRNKQIAALVSMLRKKVLFNPGQ